MVVPSNLNLTILWARHCIELSTCVVPVGPRCLHCWAHNLWRWEIRQYFQQTKDGSDRFGDFHVCPVGGSPRSVLPCAVRFRKDIQAVSVHCTCSASMRSRTASSSVHSCMGSEVRGKCEGTKLTMVVDKEGLGNSNSQKVFATQNVSRRRSKAPTKASLPDSATALLTCPMLNAIHIYIYIYIPGGPYAAGATGAT